MLDFIGDVLMVVLLCVAAAFAVWLLTPQYTPAQVCAQHPGWTIEVCQDVANHAIWVGMTPEMAIASIGYPARVNRSGGEYGTTEQWVYETGKYSRAYLYFRDGVLSSWQL
jgi:hypothetical protein